MAFADAVRTLANQIQERRKHVATEEAAKQALLLPFLGLLGFDIYNPAELIPEYRAGWAKGAEKIDYALVVGGKLALFVEAKSLTEPLVNYDPQLAKYFNSTPEVKFCIITNGVEYRFFTDLQEPNLLDKKPFFEFNFGDFTETDIAVLERFRRDVFSVEKLVGYAEDLVFLSTLKNQFKNLLRDPSDDFIIFALKAADLAGGRMTQKVIDRFRPLIRDSISAAILEIVGQSLHLQAAVEPVTAALVASDEAAGADTAPPPTVVTTEEELRAFEIVKEAVSSQLPEPDKLRYQDTGSYFSIIYGNNRGWFVRFYIDDREKKSLVLRLPLERVRELAPDFEAVEAPPVGNGLSRIYIQSVEDLPGLSNTFIEAVTGLGS